jgi:hypothetical protein
VIIAEKKHEIQRGREYVSRCTQIRKRRRLCEK